MLSSTLFPLLFANALPRTVQLTSLTILSYSLLNRAQRSQPQEGRDSVYLKALNRSMGKGGVGGVQDFI